jgi:hypothetical protein
VGRSPSIAQLPFIDEHATFIATGTDRVWLALTQMLDRSLSGGAWARYARAIGCADVATAGPRPLTAGSALVGFRVVEATHASELALAGRHHFSSYALIFRLEELDAGQSRVSAETRAEFPGVMGYLYRLLVVGTGGHVVGVRRLLSATKRRSEQQPGPSGVR